MSVVVSDRPPVPVAHHAFDRYTTYRRIVTPTHRMQRCKVCDRLNRYNKLYEFGTCPDDRLSGKIDWEGKYYCSKDCHDGDYHAAL